MANAALMLPQSPPHLRRVVELPIGESNEIRVLLHFAIAAARWDSARADFLARAHATRCLVATTKHT
jgi:hypothetical protein